MRKKQTSRRIAGLLVAVIGGIALAAPILPGHTLPGGLSRQHSRLNIVASTPIIADLISNVAPDANVTSLVPAGVDPHTYSPSLAALRSVAHADIAFTNGLLLEDQALEEMVSANLSNSAPHVVLAEESVQYGAKHRALVEDASLSSIWLGFRADGSGGNGDTVRIRAIKADGDGDISAFSIGTFGQPSPWISSSDGIDESDGLTLPANAHTHMSWGFSAPGEYRLTLAAQHMRGDEVLADLGQAEVTFMVGKRPKADADTQSENAESIISEADTSADESISEGSSKKKLENEHVLDSGHADIAAHMDGRPMSLDATSAAGTTMSYSPKDTVIYVPHSVATLIPSQDWTFLGEPGEEAWILAQAVLGEHVHGEIDPHMWHDVSNAIAYVEVIRERLSQRDPQSAQDYMRNAESYIQKLEHLNEWIRTILFSIPESERQIITAHDSFGYLADTYGVRVAGFVAANPSLEPSVRTMANLTATIRDTGTKALFLEPGARVHSAELTNLAHATGAQLCSIYSDTFGGQVDSYVELMEFNVRSLATCLNPDSAQPWDLDYEPVELESSIQTDEPLKQN